MARAHSFLIQPVDPAQVDASGSLECPTIFIHGKLKLWRGRPPPAYLQVADFNSDVSSTILHEAYHAAASLLCLGMDHQIVVHKNGHGHSRSYESRRWERIAVWLAPALLNDLSHGDVQYLVTCNRHAVAYAWGWLHKNRRRVQRVAKMLARRFGSRPGRLDITGVTWRCGVIANIRATKTPYKKAHW